VAASRPRLPARIAPEADPTRQRILATIDSVPRGKVASYGQIALEAGLPGRARLVGRTLGTLPFDTKLAWYRIVNAAGRISTTGACAREQRRRLRSEGVTVDARGRVDMRVHRWMP